MVPNYVPPKTTQVYVFKINAFGRVGQGRIQIYGSIGSKFGANQQVTSLAERRHPNVAAVALANKTARIAWAMLRTGSDYKPDYIEA